MTTHTKKMIVIVATLITILLSSHNVHAHETHTYIDLDNFTTHTYTTENDRLDLSKTWPSAVLMAEVERICRLQISDSEHKEQYNNYIHELLILWDTNN